jgi:hypothetical protein
VPNLNIFRRFNSERNLAVFIIENSNLDIVTDDKGHILVPGEHEHPASPCFMYDADLLRR